MKAFEKTNFNDQSSFFHLKRLGLSAGIRNLRDYRLIVGAAAEEAVKTYLGAPFLTEVTPLKIRTIHWTLFEKVHPWAGQFRKDGEGVQIGGFNGAHPGRISAEIALLIRQTQHIMRQKYFSEDLQEDIAPTVACAFFHVRYERIHPYRDGNGRSGRTLLQLQMYEACKDLVNFASREDYIHSLREANEGDLTDLVNLLRVNRPRVESGVLSPFRIAPLEVDDLVYDLPLEEQLNYSFVDWLRS